MGVRGQLSVPSVVLGAEMAGPSLYGSFRAGLNFSSGDATVGNYGSRWGINGSHEVSEGLTAAYLYETGVTITNAESAGGPGHTHDAFAAIADTNEVLSVIRLAPTVVINTGDHDSNSETDDTTTYMCERGNPVEILKDDMMEPTGHQELDEDTEYEGDALVAADVFCGNVVSHTDAGSAAAAAISGDGGPGGRLSSISLSGGFGTISMGYMWSASYNHYAAALDPTYFNGLPGGATYKSGNAVSYSSSAGDVSFQIDKQTGDDGKLEFGATAALGPVGVGFGYWKNANDDASFTGIAISAGAGGVGLAVGLGNEKDEDGMKTSTNLISLSGALGDSGISYGVQVANSDDDAGDQNLVSLVNSLGTGASLHFEHVSPGEGSAKSHVVIKVDF